MRIGELLIACDLITAKQLQAGLEYARAKGLPIGRVLKVLKHLDDDALEIALFAQRCIRDGMDPQIVVAAAKESIETCEYFDEVLKKYAVGGAPLPPRVDPQDLIAVERAESKTAAEVLKMAEAAMMDDRLDDAERHYKLAIEKFESEKADVLVLADACSRRAAFYLLTDRLAESEADYRRVLQVRQQKLGEDDISVARVYTDLADVFDIGDEFAKSIEHALKACAILEKHLPGSFDEFYAPLRKLTAFSKKLAQSPRRRMGELLTESGLLSEEKLQNALQHSKQTGKPLGSVLKDDGFLDDQGLQSLLSAQLLMKEGVLSEEIAVQSLKVASKMNMPLRAVVDHFKLLAAATDDDSLAELVMEQDRLLTAETALGVNHPQVGVIAYSLAEKHFARNSLADAEVFMKRVLAIEKLTNEIPIDVVGSATEKLALIYKATGRDLLAAPLLLRALECLSKAGQSESERGMCILIALADVEMKQKNFAVALSFLRSANALQDKLQAEDEGRISVLDKLGACLVETDQLSEAEKMLNRLVTVASQVYGAGDLETARFMERLGDVHVWLGASDQAQMEYTRCMQMYEYALNAAPGAAQAVADKLAKLKN